MEIKTRRCLIREFLEDDLDSFMEYRNNDEWMKFQEFKNKSKEEYQKILLNDCTLKEGKQLAIIHNNHLIGDIYLKEENDVYWIGYTISPSYAKQGFAYEAVRETMVYLHKHGVKVFKAEVDVKNIQYIKLLEKLNFVFKELNENYLLYIYQFQ